MQTTTCKSARYTEHLVMKQQRKYAEISTSYINWQNVFPLKHLV